MAPVDDSTSARNKCDILRDIVVGVGGSERSFAALRYGIELARATRAPVRAVVVDTIRANLAMALAHGDTLQRLIADGERLAHAEGQRIAARIRRTADGLDVGLTVEHESGAVVECLTMASSKASLLVVGKRGHRDEHGGLLGTNTELLARRVRVPVLMTPKEFRPIREVVVAYAAKELGARNLATAEQLCSILKVRLRVVTVAKEPKSGDQVLAQVPGTLRDRNVPTTFEVLQGRVAAELAKTTTEESLLILGASGHSRAYHLLLGDVTVEAMRSANGPVLLSSKLGESS